jgi:hypothetical protein
MSEICSGNIWVQNFDVVVSETHLEADYLPGLRVFRIEFLTFKSSILLFASPTLAHGRC